jgi:hypothetical protein
LHIIEHIEHIEQCMIYVKVKRLQEVIILSKMERFDRRGCADALAPISSHMIQKKMPEENIYINCTCTSGQCLYTYNVNDTLDEIVKQARRE